MKHTVLHDRHVALGARIGPFGGFQMPIQYTGILDEHRAARTAAAVFDTCHMGEFRVAGSDALLDLERLVSCDLADLDIGRCRYGFLCNERGGIIDDLIVYRLGSNEFMLVVNSGTRAGDYQWIRDHLGTGTQIADLSDETAKIDVQGPGAPRIVRDLVDDPIDRIRFFGFAGNGFRGRPLLVSRTGYTGEIGFELYADAVTAPNLWDACVERGAAPAGLGARDTLRLEMGYPLYGQDLGADRNAAESGFTRAISTAKDFIGAEAVRDHARVGRCLAGLRLTGRRAARTGDRILGPEGAAGGEITSGSFAPSVGVAVALGYVDKDLAEPGRELSIETARGQLDAVVSPPPFHTGGTARRPLAEFLD